ncbi:four helix bundle protein [uncultured Thiocystis sp.]|uniref:four helix bundle protein n=1 Tax=uncultured Thiocystis sp. TaxID=1202134 RepID=UPI0025DD72DE|nr:four helix bundle protein [uncultured Thiocystis sp.]
MHRRRRHYYFGIVIGYWLLVIGGILATVSFEKLEIYQLSERLSDELWVLVLSWDSFAKDTLGKQLVRAVDSIGANIAEGSGRGSFQDNRRFVRIARGSLNETRHWLRRAFKRGLLTQSQVESLKPLLDELAPRLNAYLNSISRNITNEQITNNK